MKLHHPFSYSLLIISMIFVLAGVSFLLSRQSQKQPSIPITLSGTFTPQHIFLIVMENKSYDDLIDNDKDPYIHSLISQYSSATNYSGVAHPSLPNYLALVGGDTFGITSDCTTCFINKPNLADSLEHAGKSWKAYAEDMPAAGFIGDHYPYAQKHNPFVYFDDIRNNQSRFQSRVVPLSQFTADVKTDSVPDFSFIIPNLCHDTHDCSMIQGDSWLSIFIPQLMQTSAYQNNGVIFITFDEGGELSPGNRILTLIISSKAKRNFQSSTPQNHYSLLRTIEEWWHLPTLSKEETATPMTEYF